MAGPIRISILGNGSQARRDAALTARAYSGLGRSLKSTAATVGLTSLAAGIVGVAKKSVDLEAKFSQTMNTIAAATGATGGQITKLNDLAIKLGADTSFSANEAADAMLELAKAGISTSDIMGGSLSGTLQLAAAGGTELGTAATIASNAMNAFSLRGKDMASVAAALAGGANASSASVESLGQGLQQVGAGAVNAGLSLQQTVGVLSAFDAAGIKGSDAGTSLKTMLTRLVPSTTAARDAMDELGLKFVNADGSFRGISTVAEQLRKRMGGLSEAQRTAALSTIFGSDASRAATVLMRQGADGVRKFIKATRDQGAAQEMAEARMKGTAGALERLGGAVETAQLRIGQELAPVVVKTADAIGDNLGPALEAVIDGAKDLGAAVGPAVKAVVDVLGDLIPSADQAGGIFRDVLLPTVRTVSDVIAAAVGVIDGLPDPLKSLGIQAGIAALVLPRLTGAVSSVTGALTLNIAKLQQFRAELTYTQTRAQIVSNAMTKLGGAARTAAGIGGLMAVTSAAQKTRGELGTLEGAAAGALLGFGVAGPIGAAIGGGAGALYSFVTALRQTGDAAPTAAEKTQQLVSKIDALAGAASKANRELVLQELQQSGMISTAGQLGVRTQDLIGAALGQEGAYKRVTRQLNDYDTVLGGLSSASVRDWLLNTSAGIRQQANEARQAAFDTSTYAERLRGVPKSVRVALKQAGFPQGKKAIDEIIRGANLTPKQIRIVYRALEARGVIKSTEEVRRGVERVNKTKPNLSGFLRGLTQDLTGAGQRANRGGKQVSDNLREGTSKAKPNLQPFTRSFTGTIDGLKPKASSGGSTIGGNLGAGIYGGVGAWAGPIASQAASIVRRAVAAAKAEAKIKSPSRVMRDEVGVMLGRGLAWGLNASGGEAENAGRKLVDRLVRGSKGGLDGIRDVLGRLRDMIEKRQEQSWDRIEKGLRKRFKGKELEKRLAAAKRSWRGHTADVTGLLKTQRDALIANGKAQDRVTAKLEKARQRLSELVSTSRDYAANIKSVFVQFGNVTELGRDEDGRVKLTDLVSQLRERAATAKKFSAFLTALQASGLNQTAIDDLIARGPEEALATAQAIFNGGYAAIAEINNLTKDLATTGAKLGGNLASAFYGAGIEAAAAVVDGLKKRQAELDKIADRLARRLVEALQKALGETGGAGGKNSKMLALSLDNTHSKTPALDGYQAAKQSTAVEVSSAQLVQAFLQLQQEVKKQTDTLDRTLAEIGPNFGQSLQDSTGRAMRRGARG